MFSFLCSRNVSICTLPARGQRQLALSHWTSSDPTYLKRLLHSFDHDNRSSENSTDGVKNKECDHGKVAKLDECRGVIRLGGDHLVHFLQVKCDGCACDGLWKNTYRFQAHLKSVDDEYGVPWTLGYLS